MQLFDSHFLRFVELLSKHDVHYLLVGGYAVNLHGYPRTTGDMDIWVEPTYENAQKLVAAIDEYGFDATPLLEMDFSQMIVFNIGEAPAHIEIMNHISGVKFMEAYAKRKEVEIEGVQFSLIHLQDLKKNKQASARHKDLNDLEHLPEPGTSY